MVRVGRWLGVLLEEFTGVTTYSEKAAYCPTMDSLLQAKNAKCDVSLDTSRRNIFQTAGMASWGAGTFWQPSGRLSVEHEITMDFYRLERASGAGELG
jgi:hypothetical protein